MAGILRDILLEQQSDSALKPAVSFSIGEVPGTETDHEIQAHGY
ncbi:MAG TPA: hypothetical protein VN648_32770 [Candidatus Methylomirabilis sp.]|nr:hypothetical protein [Candidatus Methylomirabilis sp.]